jgi:hypothetical protein
MLEWPVPLTVPVRVGDDYETLYRASGTHEASAATVIRTARTRPSTAASRAQCR